MTNTRKTALAAGLAFLIGAALPALVVWNPGGWAWADHLVGRERAVAGDGAPSTELEKQLWSCGMHPHVVTEEPGNCPICGMRLTPMGGEPAMAAESDKKILYWRAPMDPSYVSDEPGKSPMGMDLIPVYEESVPLEDGVRVDPNFLQNFAVRTAVVERGTIPIEIRTIGVMAHNEQSVVSVNVKFDGWIEKAYFNNVGEHVERGAPLFEIYSPQLVVAQKEYLAALDYVRRLSGSAYPEAVERARSLLEASRERLLYWDFDDEQIRRIEQSGKPNRTVTAYSPASGHIVAKMGDSLVGMRLQPGMTPIKLADHSKLWAEVELYENDLRSVREDMSAHIEVRAFPGRSWRGRVALFDHAVDPKTRTLKAFVEIDNSDMKLRPQMYADVTFRPPAATRAVKVPQQAILHSGERAVVVVERSKGVFEPREVELGPEGGGYQEVRSGIEAGETVVVSSQFLIDSESNLKAAVRQLLGEREAAADREPAAAPAHQH